MFHKAKKSLGLNQVKPDRPIFPKKSLGQNFLKSEAVLKKICEVSNVTESDTVLEIGPGKGALTRKLLEQAGKVIAIEKDQNLFTYLTEIFKNEIASGKFILINDDILNFDLEKIKSYKIIANIPYNITGLILKKFLSATNQPNLMALLVQKEVAKRIVSKEESILSLSVKAYGSPEYIQKVSKRFFSPSPKVDSAIILIGDISRKNFSSTRQEKRFFEIVRAGFAHKRKLLIKNLENLPDLNKEQLLNIWADLKINPYLRAENLPFEDWLKISLIV